MQTLYTATLNTFSRSATTVLPFAQISPHASEDITVEQFLEAECHRLIQRVKVLLLSDLASTHPNGTCSQCHRTSTLESKRTFLMQVMSPLIRGLFGCVGPIRTAFEPVTGRVGGRAPQRASGPYSQLNESAACVCLIRISQQNDLQPA